MFSITNVLPLFGLEGSLVKPVQAHQGGRNWVYVCEASPKKTILRVSATGDRAKEEYLAETEFVHYLAQNGASVADVIPSKSGKTVETVLCDGRELFVSQFEYAKGMLISDNGYRYREGAPLSEYFFHTGKTLGRIHRLSKQFTPAHWRKDYFDIYNMPYLDSLIPDTYKELKQAFAERLKRLQTLPKTRETYGLVHFDFSDGNYHIDMNTGEITVFDFDNCLTCWYLFDLANLWTHGVGWCQFEEDPEKRMNFMKSYFQTILNGYRTETDISDALLNELPLLIDIVLIENIVDEFECRKRAGEAVDYEDIADAANCLIREIPFAGVGSAL